uniref:Reverse transcriptase domain-containing protein n=1 Tax=Tanacetum cinerariifolium TaxID=118510 RepID=A0A6L2MXP5_TANCI|nr:hypothetical protein [Tanacetum cinerariifolium]
MIVLLAKERILKLIQDWDEKQIKSWSLLELLLQLSNDSQIIDEMLKQREEKCIKREQVAKLAVQKEQEEQAAQNTQYQPEEIQELMSKLLEDVRNINEELFDYTNSLSWNHPIFYDNDEHSSEYLEKSSKTIAPNLPTEEPDVENLVPIPSEYEVTSDNESECDVPVNDESSPIFMTFSNPLFDCNDDFTSSDDESFSNEDVPMRIKREHEEYISLMEKLLTINAFSRPLENFHANTIIESLPTYPIPIEDSDSLREEIDIFTGTDDLMPPGIESDDYDSEGDIHFLKELLSNDFIPLPENESFNFGHHDDPSFPRPPLKPLNVEVFFDFEPNLGELISAMMNNIDELNDDECFDLGGGEIDVFENIKDDDYFPFIFVIRFFLLYLTYPEVSPLLLFTGSEDTIFDLGIYT